MTDAATPIDTAPARYLTLMREVVSASVYPESAWRILGSRTPAPRHSGEIFLRLKRLVFSALASRGLALVKMQPFDLDTRSKGGDWPMFGYSMVGHRRLENVEHCIRSVLDRSIQGDFVECGVWRGGASIYARAVLNALGATDRTVWLADSFEGLPVQQEQDKIDIAFAGMNHLAVSLDTVRQNFARFGLLADNVKFLKGWFCDTLKDAPIDKIAILRLDGDYYSSTMDALTALYDRVTLGGYIIVDDYNSLASCHRAVDDFFRSRDIAPRLTEIDRAAVFWRKS